MHYVAGVKELDWAQDVVDDCNDMRFLQVKVWGILHYSSQVGVDVIHHKHDHWKGVGLCWINIGDDDVEQFGGEDIVWHGRQFPH